MKFRILARSLIHLGADLISSDIVALYELVKNAFDAGSRIVTIKVVSRISYAQLQKLRQQLQAVQIDEVSNDDEQKNLVKLSQQALASVKMTAPSAHELCVLIRDAKDLRTLSNVIEESNYIVVRDTGEGMTLKTLNDVFLTIGTRSRQARRTKTKGRRPFLGEKGVGRLSTMRLGNRLYVQSTTEEDTHWNELSLDWSVLSHNDDLLLEDFPVELNIGAMKENPKKSGTHIRISGINADWTVEKLKSFAKEEFSRLTDPFSAKSVFPIILYFNDEIVPISQLDPTVLDLAHATVKGEFKLEGQDLYPKLSGEVKYKDREWAIDPRDVESASIINSDPNVLRTLGPFSYEVYWYNRRILKAVEDIGNRRRVQELVNQWSGGIMVFRDGFRVFPYGSGDDDWLDLDRKALGSQGYKVNRAQIIGRLSISSHNNPALIDQTNREGLRDSPEKTALKELLLYILRVELKGLLDQVDEEQQVREPVSIDNFQQRIRIEKDNANKSLHELIHRVPQIRKHGELVNGIQGSLDLIERFVQEVQQLAESYEKGRGQLLQLASIGLTVEVLAHELYRATDYALMTLTDSTQATDQASIDSSLRLLETQLKTLQKRLRVLDPLSASGRQRKEPFDLIKVVRDLEKSHSDRLRRENIQLLIIIEPDSYSKQFKIEAVTGMIIQLLENLLSNSIYWLRQKKKLDTTHPSQITITVDTNRNELRFSDNGPGIPFDIKDRIFEAFYSRKPPSQGKGLGLFVSREIAEYHGIELALISTPTDIEQTLHTFILTLGGIVR